MLFTSNLFYSQKDTLSVLNNVQVYDFTVKDCLRNLKYGGKMRKDSLKPSNVLRGERVWRTIDLENKTNKLIFNKNSNCTQVGLFEVIKFGLFEKQRNAFSSDDFNEVAKSRLTIEELKTIIQFRDTLVQTVFDANGSEASKTTLVNRYLFNEDVRSYVLKEDWFISTKSGQMERKIIGIAPLVYDKRVGKLLPLFWLYYDEWVELFNSFEGRNYLSNSLISYRTVLEKNYFFSQISKENNIFDRSIKSYKHGKDPSIESEIIKEKIYNSERDLFQY